MPLLNTSGNVTADAFGGGVAAVPNYIEDVFSTYLYTGNGSTQTITNGIDLSGKGGLTWIKRRSTVQYHHLFDTARGANYAVFSNATDANTYLPGSLSSFNSNGVSLGTNSLNDGGETYASWTFRKQPKFFDVVTYTGTGSVQNIAHNLGSAPGAMLIKRTSSALGWYCYHRSLGNSATIVLNSTNAQVTGSAIWNNTDPTSTQFTVGNSVNNTSGETYVAYLYAHNAGGFGLTGTDNVISCGSYTGNGSATGPSITLGYEPQWLLVKSSTQAYNWLLIDTMRGMPVNGSNAQLEANNSNAEAAGGTYFSPTATGFNLTSTSAQVNQSGQTYIYIAIRRGPMKVPTSGTSVFAPVVVSENTTSPYINTFTTGFPVDSVIEKFRGGSQTGMFNRLLGGNYLIASTTAAEASSVSTWDSMTASNVLAMAGSSGSAIGWNFRRAPSFFDEVCYTGTSTGINRDINHNLGVVPELAIIKKRSTTSNWEAVVPAPTAGNFYVGLQASPISLNTTNGNGTEPSYPWSSYATSTTFNTGLWWNGNDTGATYVAYLFATCAGVSKCGTFTGTGTTQQVDCGFTGGARFVLIKRTDSTGDWYVWDTARGIVSGNDPYLLLNSTAAEVTITDYIDPYSAGFELSTTAAATVNVLNGTYIYLAIA
jgi:hypothetical protein